MAAVTVTNNTEKSRYEAHLDGELAGFVDYRVSDGVIDLTHTDVDSAFEGKGIGSAPARQSLDDVRAQGGRRVVPTCPFIKGWIDKHPDYADLVGGSQAQ